MPAQVCDNWGEYILEEQATKKVLEKAEQAVANNAEIEVLKYAAREEDLANTPSIPF